LKQGAAAKEEGRLFANVRTPGKLSANFNKRRTIFFSFPLLYLLAVLLLLHIPSWVEVGVQSPD